MSQAAASSRSTVLAFLIADIRGYTTYTRTHGDEAAARLAAAFAELAREGAEAHDGAVIELRGDEVLATFGSPRQALRAALELQAILADEAALDTELPLNVGIGLDIGEAVPVEGGYRGDALNMAARLCSAAAGGEILVSESMQRVVGEMDGVVLETFDSLAVKGIDKPIRGARARRALPMPVVLPSTVGSGSALAVELDPSTPLFGRDAEARRLRWEWRRARQGDGTTVVITGPTGIGKTRLAAEPASLAARSGAWVTYGSALAAGVRAALERGVHAGPGVIVIDDLESASDDDLTALRGATAELSAAPVLLIVVSTDDARPEVSALLRALSAPANQIRLGPLDEQAVGAIVSTYAPDADNPPPVRAIADASAGRPAVIHELAAGWARQETGRQLGDAVERTVLGRRDLRQMESEVASKVVDLQLARTRLNLTARRRSLAPAIPCSPNC